MLPDLQSVHAVQSCRGICYGGGTNGAKDRHRGGQEDRGTSGDQRAGEAFGRGEERWEIVMFEPRAQKILELLQVGCLAVSAPHQPRDVLLCWARRFVQQIFAHIGSR